MAVTNPTTNNTRRKTYALLSAAAIILTATQFASAATNTWTGAFGNNIWDTTSTDWSAPANSKWTNGANTAIFSGTATGPSVTVSAAIVLNQINFNVDSTLGGTWDLLEGAGGSLANNTTAANFTISTASTGTNGIIGATIVDNGAQITTLMKTGTKTLTLNGANTYTGQTILFGGMTIVSSINSVVGGAASSNLGAPTTVANGTIDIGGSSTAPITLQYVGTGETTDRVIDLVGTTVGGVIDQSGTGLLKFTSDMTATVAGAKTLTLQGSTAGNGEFAGKIVDSASGATGLTKAGTNTWTLSTANTYSGATLVNGGTLQVTGSLGNTAVTVAAATLQLNAASAISQNTLTVSNAAAIVTENTTNALGGSAALTQSNGTVTLSLANNFTGNTTLSGGTLRLSNTGAIASSALSLGGGILQLRSDNNNDLFADASTTISASTTINVDQLTGAGANNTLRLGDISNTAATTDTITVTGADGYGLSIGALTQTPTTGTTLTILNSSAPLTIASFTTLSNAAAPKLSFTGTGTTSITGNITQSGSGALAISRGVAGGTLILQGTSNLTGAVAMTNGTIQTAVVTDAFGNTSGISIGGSGTLALRGDADAIFNHAGTAYPIALTASGATINVDQASPAGTGQTLTLGTVAMPGSYTLNITGADHTSLSLGAITGSTASNKTINNTISGGGTFTIASYAEADPSTRSITFSGSGTTTVSGAVSQTAANPLAVVVGSGTVTLNSNNTYTGATTVMAGTLKLTGAGSLASPTLIAGDTILHNTAVLDVTGVTGTYHVVTGQTLSGFGSVKGAVTVDSGGHTAPGNGASGIGTTTFSTGLTYSSGSILDYDFGTALGNHTFVAGSSDSIAVTGGASSLNFTPGNGTVTLNLASGAANIAGSGSYELLSYTNPSAVSGFTGGDGVTTGSIFLGASLTGIAGATYTLINDPTAQGIFLDFTAPGGGVPPGSGVWKNGTGDGKWTTNTGVNNNWATGIPNGVDQVATFDGTVLNGPGTVDLNGNQTVGGLILNTPSVGYTLGLPSTTNTLTLQTSTGNASISVGGAASHTINALVNLASNTNVSFTAGGSLNLVGAVSGTGSLNLSGTGTLKLSAAAGNTYTGTNVSGGNLIVANTSGSATGSSNVVMTGGTLGGGGIISGTVNASSGTQTLFPSATLATTSTTTLSVGGLTTGSGTTLQFNLVTPGNALLATTSNSDRITVTGSNGLTLNGGTVNLTNHATGAASLGFYKVIAYSGTIGGTGLSSLTLPATVANVEYTFDTTHDAGFVDIHRGFAGDVDDSGFVDINDLAILAAHWQQTGGWAQGNFLNDPLVDINDLAILAANWQTGITSFGEAADSLSGTSESFQQAVAGIVFGGVSSVPEPTSLALLGMGAVGLLVRRRRR